jgi:hypothetical protein
MSVYGQPYSTNENVITTSYIEHFSNIGFIAGKIVVNNGYLPLLYTLHDTDLAVLTTAELRTLRNTVYAKYGYIFQSRDLTNHFSQFNWYRPQYQNVDNRLTDTDKFLIQRIQAFEDAKPNNSLNARELVGTWLGSFPVAAGDNNNITFNNDNTVEIGYNTMASKAVFLSKGTYRIENGLLVIRITEQSISVGTYFHDGYGSSFGGMESDIIGSLVFSTPIRMVFPVGSIRTERFDGYNLTIRQIGSSNKFK